MNTQELAALAAAATAGPWEYAEGYDQVDGKKVVIEYFVRTALGDTDIALCGEIVDEYGVPNETNAAFIAACRDAVPALVEENERLTAQLAQAHGKNADLIAAGFSLSAKLAEAAGERECMTLAYQAERDLHVSNVDHLYQELSKLWRAEHTERVRLEEALKHAQVELANAIEVYTGAD